MSDKFRKTFPLRITFGAGERPTNGKLSAISEQARNGLSLVESAIGSLWNQSGDSLLLDYPLQIPNLARLLGQNYFLNPAIYPIENDFTFREYVNSKFAYQTIGHLTFKPKSGTTPTASGTAFSGANVTNEYEVGQSAGTWFIDQNTGKLRTDLNMGTSGSEYVQYEVEPEAYWFNRLENFPGVIPDPRQSEFTSCRVEENGGRFYLHLPPRMPLDFNTGGYERPDSEPEKYPTATDIAASYNRATDTSTPFKLWQAYVDSSTLALAHQHYRYSLPREIRELAPSGGTEYSQGFMWLWDTTLGHVLDGIVFRAPTVAHAGETWVIEISSDTVDLSVYVLNPGDDESEASYNNSGLALITCGSPVARSIWNLSTAVMNHTHDNEGHHTSLLSHNSLNHLNPPIATGNEHSSRYPSYLPRWQPSAWNSDDHASLLSRGGSQGTHNATSRDWDNDNAMLGHLVLANSIASGDSFLNASCPDESFRLYFGAVDGPSIYALDNETWIEAETLRLLTSGQDVLGLQTDGHANEWLFYVDDVYGSLKIYRDGNSKSIDISDDGTVWIGASNWKTDQNAALVVKNASYSQIVLWDGNSDTRGASLYSASSGETYFSNADLFMSNGRTGNTWINICGMSGVKLRYGDTGEGTIGAFLDNNGSLYIADDDAFTLVNTSLGIDADGKASNWNALNAQNPSLTSGQRLRFTLGRTETDYNCADIAFEYQGDADIDNALLLGFRGNQGIISIYNGQRTRITGSNNDGSIGALEIATGGPSRVMLLDGSKIDTTVSGLEIQTNSELDTTIGGDLEVRGDVYIGGSLLARSSPNPASAVSSNGRFAVMAAETSVDVGTLAVLDVVPWRDKLLWVGAGTAVATPNGQPYIGSLNNDPYGLSINITATQAETSGIYCSNATASNYGCTTVGDYFFIVGRVSAGDTTAKIMKFRCSDLVKVGELTLDGAAPVYHATNIVSDGIYLYIMGNASSNIATSNIVCRKINAYPDSANPPTIHSIATRTGVGFKVNGDICLHGNYVLANIEDSDGAVSLSYLVAFKGFVRADTNITYIDDLQISSSTCTPNPVSDGVAIYTCGYVSAQFKIYQLRITSSDLIDTIPLGPYTSGSLNTSELAINQTHAIDDNYIYVSIMKPGDADIGQFWGMWDKRRGEARWADALIISPQIIKGGKLTIDASFVYTCFYYNSPGLISRYGKF